MTDTSLSGDLVERLRYQGYLNSDNGDWGLRNPDGPEAADRIEQLEREKAVVSDLWEQQKEIALGYLADCNKAADRIKALEAENERLRGALEQFLALIKHQYFGSREAMNALQEADNAARAALGESHD